MNEIKRVYEGGETRGKRFLVERLWPRGIKKEDLAYDEWLKDVALKQYLEAKLGAEAKRRSA